MQESTTAFRREEVTGMVLGKKKSKNDYRTFENDYRTFEAIFDGLAEESDEAIVMDPRNGARKVSTVKRLSEDQKEGWQRDHGIVWTSLETKAR